MNIYNNYKNKSAKNSVSMSNISSGLKLNKAKDNPNKIQQSQSIKIQIISNSAAQKNIQDTVSMIQTFDGVMNEMNNSLSRLKELTINAHNGTMNESDLHAIQLEINELTEHITHMADSTNFNGIKLLNSDGNVETMIGAFEGETTKIPQINLTSDALGIANLDILNPDNVDICNKEVDLAIVKISNARSIFGAIQSKLEQSYDNMNSNSIVLQSVQSRIADADIAEEMLKFSESEIFIQSSISLMAQSNKLPQDALQVLANIK